MFAQLGSFGIKGRIRRIIPHILYFKCEVPLFLAPQRTEGRTMLSLYWGRCAAPGAQMLPSSIWAFYRIGNVRQPQHGLRRVTDSFPYMSGYYGSLRLEGFCLQWLVRLTLLMDYYLAPLRRTPLSRMDTNSDTTHRLGSLRFNTWGALLFQGELTLWPSLS